MKNIFFLLVLIVISSCERTSFTISTKDVKGTIEAPGSNMVVGSLFTQEGNFEQAIISFEDFEIVIRPTTKTLEEIVETEQSSNDAFNTNVTEEEKKEGYIFYKENKDFAGEKSEGYRFFMLTKGKSKTYLLRGSGKMFKAIPTREKAIKALNAAKSFKPED